MDGSFSRVPAWVLVPVALVSIGLGLLIGRHSGVYDRVTLKQGMTQQQVESLLGAPDTMLYKGTIRGFAYGPFIKDGKKFHRLTAYLNESGELRTWERSSP